MTPADFVEELARLELPGVFNPYRDVCPDCDLADAPAVRRDNLARVLDACLLRGTDTMWVARDLGYRGGRRTGLPMTDDVRLDAASRLYGAKGLARATRGPPVRERTSTVVYTVLSRVERPAFLWNVFPYHPHERGDPMSNRCHTTAERKATWHLLEALLDLLRPSAVFAIGGDAMRALAAAGTPCIAVRHPSYGGQTDFLEAMSRHYGLDGRPNPGSAATTRSLSPVELA